jgi:putative nucleotidyltransferase with HDIG domain
MMCRGGPGGHPGRRLEAADQMTEKGILFIARDPIEREGLRESLKPWAAEWGMVFLNTGAQGLDYLEKARIDAVVVGSSTPVVLALDFLKELRRRFPRVLQFIITEGQRPQLPGKYTFVAPQQVPRECTAAQLAATLQRSLRIAQWLADDAVRKLIGQIHRLPSLPSLYLKIVERMQSPNADIAEIALLISQDAAMCAQILKVANSASLAALREICSAFEAVLCLGVERTKALILFTHCLSSFPLAKSTRFPVHRFSQHSLATALFAQKIVQAEALDVATVQEAFTAGLLHDIGKLILATGRAEPTDRAPGWSNARIITGWPEDREVSGSRHDTVGACLLGIWGLSLDILEAVAWHHYPGLQRGKQFTLLTAVHVANCLAHKRAAKPTSGEAANINLNYLDRIGLADRYGPWHDLCLGEGNRLNSQFVASEPFVSS